ncbi:MAG: pyridoxamine 5-phosphate oxidase family protein [Glaciihabitans sp.]|nr:pyridoxamine 5-phosphate oxidase family protein [Glaciihabitans sp.]MDQ1569815.1 uncharacterized protein [Actinomycetota bacterium]
MVEREDEGLLCLHRGRNGGIAAEHGVESPYPLPIRDGRLNFNAGRECPFMAHEVSEDEWSPQGPVTEITDAASWALLDSSSFGRLGLSVEDRPEIFPVNYATGGRTILFRTAAGTKLHDLVANRFVAFEVDSEGPVGTWSVVVKGTADTLQDAEVIAAADLVAFPPWIPTVPYVYVRITPETIRGRQFQHRLRAERL